MRPRTPFGFWVAGVVSALFCALMLIIMWEDGAEHTLEGSEVAWRSGATLLAVLAAVVTEALWRARPWVWRASLALALAYAVITFVGTAADPASNVGEAFALLMASAVPVVPLLAYIRGRAKVMWPKQPPQPAAPIAVPRPLPPMHPAPRPGGRP